MRPSSRASTRVKQAAVKRACAFEPGFVVCCSLELREQNRKPPIPERRVLTALALLLLYKSVVTGKGGTVAA